MLVATDAMLAPHLVGSLGDRPAALQSFSGPIPPISKQGSIGQIGTAPFLPPHAVGAIVHARPLPRGREYGKLTDAFGQLED